MNKLLYIPFLFFISCNLNNSGPKIKPISSQEDSILNTKDFIQEFEELNDSCTNFLINKLYKFYSEKESDIKKVYSINATLLPEHYTKEENTKIQKFACFVERSNETELIFFGIDRKTSDYLWLNELSTSDHQSSFLTKEEHYRWNTDFSLLEDYDILDIELHEGLGITENSMSLGTFEHDSSYIWIVDSVFVKNSSKSLFNAKDTFQVINNNQMVFQNKSISYFFENWQIYFVRNQDTIPARIISFSNSSRIIIEEMDGEPMTFMTKKRKL